ncbi:MAG: hypothetical protein L0G99_06045, partial [Propionibacteriales bacterium]|nr:hypothetical protein [Propionibacteriales bacterium]
MMAPAAAPAQRQLSLARSLAAVRDRRSVVVVGDRGSGKWSFVRRVLAAIDPDQPLLTVHGGSGRGDALDDVVQALPEDARPTGHDETEVIAALTAAGGTPLIVLRDAERADRDTRRLLGRLAARGAIVLLSTVDEEAVDDGDPFRPLLDHPEAIRIDLHPLAAREADQVIDHVVRRHAIPGFGPAEHAWVRAMAGGVHDLAERVTLDLAELLANGTPVSGLTGSTPSRPTLRLASDLLATVPGPARFDLSVVAHLGGATVSRAADRVPPTSLGMLLQRGLVRVHEGSLRVPAPLRHALLWQPESPRLEAELDRAVGDVVRDVAHGWQVTSDEVLFAARRLGHRRLDIDPALAQPLLIIGASILARSGEARAAAAMAWTAHDWTSRTMTSPVPTLVDALVRTGEWQQAALAEALAPESFHAAPPSLQELLLQAATAPCTVEACAHDHIARSLKRLELPAADTAHRVVEVHLDVRGRRYEEALAAEVAEASESADL